MSALGITDVLVKVMHCYACKAAEDFIWTCVIHNSNVILPPNCKIKITHKEQITFSNLFLSVLITVKSFTCLRLIVKRPMIHELLPCSIFRHELMFYTMLVPHLQEEKNFVPRCFTNEYSPIINLHSFIVLEDLSAKGYRVVHETLDEAHLTLCMKALARLHSRLYLLEKEYELVPYINFSNKIVIGQVNPNYKKKLRKIRFFNTHAIVWHKLNSQLAEKLTAKLHNMEEKIAIPLKNRPFTFVIHGRFVRSKVMFKYDESHAPKSVKIIGWQAVSLDSPTVDFGRILLSNLPDENNITKIEQFLRKMLAVYLDNAFFEGKERDWLEREFIENLMSTYVEYCWIIKNHMALLYAFDKLGALN